MHKRLVIIMIIENILQKLFGRNLYKTLKSIPDLEWQIIRVAKTFKALQQCKKDDDIVKGVDTFNTYKFFKCNIFDMLTYKYAVLNENFSKEAVYSGRARLVDFIFRNDFAYNHIRRRFDFSTIGCKYELTQEQEIELLLAHEYFEDGKRTTFPIMTALEWNNWWQEMISISGADKTLENLACKDLKLFELSGVLRDPLDEIDDEIIEQSREDGTFEEKYGDEFQSNTIWCDFKAGSEAIAKEFCLLMIIPGSHLEWLSSHKVTLSPSEVTSFFDVDQYLFGDI